MIALVFVMVAKISAAEWEVMNVVWATNPITASKVFEALQPEKDWALKTVNTFLARLVEKGVISARRNGKANVYRPLIGRDACVTSESEHFLQRVFQGAAGSLVQHFCERAELTSEEISELEQLLRRKKGK